MLAFNFSPVCFQQLDHTAKRFEWEVEEGASVGVSAITGGLPPEGKCINLSAFLIYGGSQGGVKVPTGGNRVVTCSPRALVVQATRTADSV